MCILASIVESFMGHTALKALAAPLASWQLLHLATQLPASASRAESRRIHPGLILNSVCERSLILGALVLLLGTLSPLKRHLHSELCIVTQSGSLLWASKYLPIPAMIV